MKFYSTLFHLILHSNSVIVHLLTTWKSQATLLPVYYVVVCTDLSGKEPRRQVDMATVIASGSLGCC